MIKVKDHFVSRFENGVLIEFDWSQLEVFTFAFLTKDQTLYKLLKNGIDMHKYVGALFYNKPMEQITTEERKAIKPGNFELIYGGNPYSLMHNKGMLLEDAQKLYDAFWDLFPTAKLNYDNLYKEVIARGKLINEKTSAGEFRHESFYKTVTGRKCYFKTYDNTPYQIKKGNKTKFKYPEVVNYRGQSLATADIHLIALGKLFRKVIELRKNFLLINTVHDSVLIDCREDCVNETCKLVKTVLESVVIDLKEKFNIFFDLPLRVDCKIGKSWSEMKEYNINEVIHE